MSDSEFIGPDDFARAEAALPEAIERAILREATNGGSSYPTEHRFMPLSCPDMVVLDDGDGIEFVAYPDEDSAKAQRRMLGKYKVDSWDADSMASIIALLNGGLPKNDPRKITLDHVTALRDVVFTHLSEIRRVTPESGERLLRLADALQSYLPPA